MLVAMASRAPELRQARCHHSVVSPSGGQVLFVVSNEETGGLLARELGEDVRPEGETSVDGQAWASSVVRGDERALVRTDAVRSGDGQTLRTVIVVGHAPLDELTALAASLDS